MYGWGYVPSLIFSHCCFPDNSMHRQRHRCIQKCSWHTFVYAPLVVAGVIYLTYRTVLIPSTADSRSPASSQDHCSRSTTMASWAKNFTDLPQGVLKTAQEIDVQERSLALKFKGQVSIYLLHVLLFLLYLNNL